MKPSGENLHNLVLLVNVMRTHCSMSTKLKVQYSECHSEAYANVHMVGKSCQSISNYKTQATQMYIRTAVTSHVQTCVCTYVCHVHMIRIFM